jgi:ABC-type nickel/cobalt efflux system permease component RcnA
MNAQVLLILAVAAVGFLHTLVPDHWAPIALLARQQGWGRKQSARVAAGAGLGHTLSTLALALVVWFVGILAAQRLGGTIGYVSSGALIFFGTWIAIFALRDLHREEHHGHAHHRHFHLHRHADGIAHSHLHAHHDGDRHEIEGNLAVGSAPLHEHKHAPQSSRMALMLILGSSPMIEGIPAFFAASKYGVQQLAVMALVFAVSTIATYVGLVLLGREGLSHVNLGPVEQYGEVLSGLVIAAIGVVFLIWPAL